jgi:signal transduction histidine kinase
VSSAATTHRIFAPPSRRGFLIDVAIAAATLAGSLALLRHGGFDPAGSEPRSGGLDWISGLLVAWSTVPLVAWRRAPGTVFALTALASVPLGGLGYRIGLPLGPIAALYLFAASRDEQDAWTRRDTVVVASLLLGYLGATALAEGGIPWSELFHTGLAWAVAWFAGERTRLMHEHLVELSERARRVELEGEHERRLAVAEERARIARDLHDAAANAVNVIAVRAGTARIRRDADRSQMALEAIEELARRTAAEIDQIVGALRDRGSSDGAVDAPPGLASLETLLAPHVAAGLDVTLASEGEPRQLETAVDQAAYRILQEAIANAARHGSGTARVELAFGEAALDLTISNAVSGQSASRVNGGHGLIGMRERATLLGGSLEVGRDNGSFRVRAHLPFQDTSA